MGVLTIQSISNLDLLKILDDDTHETHYGCNQEWFPTKWQRLSGCGPSVATNIIYYLSQTQDIFGVKQGSNNKNDFLELMEEVWKYVTPTLRGIHTTKMFYDSVLSYAVSKGVQVGYQHLDVPKQKSKRPELSGILKFLKEALLKDSPIAFLNLCNGHENNLDKWHWVTITSIEYNDAESSLFADVLDEGLIKKVDLALWYNTTKQGGGFVYFTCER